MAYRNGYDQMDQRLQYDLANDRHDGNKWAIKNHLRKHYGYNEDNAWAIYEQFSGNKRDAQYLGDVVDGNGQTLGDILALKSKANVTDDVNYIVVDLDGNIAFQGEPARQFVNAADKVGIPRNSYRLFVEVYS